MNEIKVINENNKIAESTKLIREMFDNTITKRQMDLIYSIISMVQPDDAEFKEYKITYRAFGKILNPSNPDCEVTKNDVKKALSDIMKGYFKLTYDTTEKYYHWVEKAENHIQEGYVTFRLSKDVQEFYLQLKTGEYTVYLLNDILVLSTTFQANLYRWLACNSNFNNTIKINIDDAKRIFYGSDKIATSRLIEKIDTALKKINKVTNITASYTKIKGSDKKTFVRLEFKIKNRYTINKSRRKPSQLKSDEEKKVFTWEKNRIAEEVLEKDPALLNEYDLRVSMLKTKKMIDKINDEKGSSIDSNDIVEIVLKNKL